MTAALQRPDGSDPTVRSAPKRSQAQTTNGPNYPRVRLRPSRAVGLPQAGRLVGGTQLPSRGPGFTTWDPITRQSPSRGWRRYGTAPVTTTPPTVL